tara:strand:- start:32 stop:1231 length:1200 start_codon:yes stop_codon:yes gene_type:complete
MATSKVTNLSILDDAVRTAGIQDAAVTPAKTSGVPTLFLPNAQPFFINGDMQVAQRGTSFAQPDTNNDAFPVDRFNFNTGAIGVYTSTQEALTSGAAFNDGFKMAARIDCTTAQASPAAGDYFWFQYNAEAQDCLAWKKGTTSATVMTLSFWVKSNKTGTAQVNLRDMDNDRMVCALYTISSGDTWEKKVVTFPMETSNPMNNDNGTGFRFQWPLGGGSSYTSGTAPTAWEARTDADVAANNLSINDNTANDWAITGIQAEVGTFTSTTLPPFQHESYGDNLERCSRYYYFYASEATNGGTDTSLCVTTQYNTSQCKGLISFPCSMRAKPTLSQNTGSSMYRLYSNNANATMDSLSLAAEGTYNYAIVYNGTSVSVTAGTAGILQTMDSTASVAFDSEL